GQRGRTGLEVGTRAEYRVGVDHGAGIAPGDVLAQVRLVDSLVIDTGVGGDDVHAPQRGDNFLFLRRLARVLAHALAVREVHAAGVGGGAHCTARAAAGFFLEPREARVSHHLDVAHHVDVG